jgi:hypothetical protein
MRLQLNGVERELRPLDRDIPLAQLAFQTPQLRPDIAALQTPHFLHNIIRAGIPSKISE